MRGGCREAKKREREGRGWGVKGCLGQNVLIPHRHPQIVTQGFYIVSVLGCEPLSWFDCAGQQQRSAAIRSETGNISLLSVIFS